ncbi:MAG: hypothetical protein PHF84_04185 [bacterium]|nr:hypothetical protein [bacterium]
MRKGLPFILLLGRPGCGKSAVYKILTRKLQEKGLADEFERIDDFPILKELLDKDTECKRHVRKDGGFAVTDWTIIDEVLQEINDRVFQKAADHKVLFIEFARANYKEALANFTKKFLDHSAVLYIKASFELCLARNEERFKAAQEKNLDDHIVPPDLMRTYYKDDDIETLLDARGEQYLTETWPMRFFILDNNVQGIDILNIHLNRFVTFYQSIIKK